MSGTSPLGIWRAGIVIGLSTFRREPLLGLKRLILPVSYWRAAEFAYVWRVLRCRAGGRVLDLGSPKDLACMLARHRHLEVVATDILPSAVELSRRYAAAQGLEGNARGRVRSETQDGRSLSYADGSFDAAYSVSVLEHIPDSGDSLAIKELLRVVRPGGVVVVTVPYDTRYRETFVDGPVYERRPKDSERVFFERHYDADALSTRLFAGSGATPEDLELWGEGALRVEMILSRIGPLRVPVSPVEALLAAGALRRIDKNGAGHPMAAFFVLRKPG